MGGGKSPPSPPDYTPFIQASQVTSQSDAHAADLQFQLGQDQLAAQKDYAAKSAAQGDQYFQMAQQQAAWGKQQFDQVWPYAQNYLQSQDTLNQLAGKSAQEAISTSEQQRQQSADTYARYMSTFAPIENQFAQTAINYNTPERAKAASAAAQGDVATAFQGIAEANRAALRSYGIDPSQSRYQGADAILASQRAAAQAAAGTQARRQNEQTALALQQGAIEVGQKLPPTAIAQGQLGTATAASGLAYGGVGGTGINSAFSGLTAGTGAQGSPTSYAALSNPYTTLAGQFGSSGGGLFTGGTSALGNISSAINAGAGAMDTGFKNQMSTYQAQVQQQQALWGGIGKLAGGALSLVPFSSGAGGYYGSIYGTGGL